MNPMAIWSELKSVARQTPASRNRYVDFLRVLAIGAVVFGHWLMPAPYFNGQDISLDHLFNIVPWTRWLTWLFQVMPIFFFVGGYANSASWESAGRKNVTFAEWAGQRLTRLLFPLVPLILAWAVVGLAAPLLPIDVGLLSNASQLALIPIWFLAVYIMVTLVTPITYSCWYRYGAWSFWALAFGAVACDALAIATEANWIRWANYGFIWLAMHQLGYAWRHRYFEENARPLLLVAIGAAGLAIVITVLSYPIAMVSVPGAAMSNSRPPNVALLALGIVQIGLLLLVASPVRRWLERDAVWAIVIAGNRIIMTLFLWHVTVLVACVGVSWLFGGFGLASVPGSEIWWWLRIPWLLALIVTTFAVVALLSRFETQSKIANSAASATQVISGGVLACGGLIFLALGGIMSDTGTGISILPFLATIFGIILILRPNLLRG
jgi:hypothetical protein